MVSFASEFQCCYFCDSSCLFDLSFNFDFYVTKKMQSKLGIFHANQTTKCLRNQGRTKGRGLEDRKLVETPSNFIAGRPKAALLFWFFGDFRCGMLLFIVIIVIF